MFRPLLKKCVHDAKWLLAANAAAVFAFCWLRVWIVSQIDTNRFKAILDLLPGEWQKFTPVDVEWLITYEGRIALAYDELIVVMCMTIWAVARGSDAVSGEIGRGTMEMVLAQPLSRLKWLSTHAFVTTVGVAVLAAVAWLGNYAGIQLTTVVEEVAPSWHLPVPLPWVGSEVPIPFGEPHEHLVFMADRVDPSFLIPASVNLFALGVMIAGFSTAVSSWDRYRWRTIGIVVGVYVLQLLIKIAGMAADDWNWLLYFSIFTAYEPELIARLAESHPEHLWSFFLPADAGIRFGPAAYHGVMLSVGAASFGIATVVFCRRDIPAPL
jgi:ABC-2 type transport system permease protein